MDKDKIVDFKAYEIDGIDYLLLDKVVLDGTIYLYLSNKDDDTDIMFRKVDNNDTRYLLPLSTREEVEKVAKAFTNRK